MDRIEIIENNPLVEYIECNYDVEINRIGKELSSSVCPVAPHRNGHRCVNINEDKQAWYCNDCAKGGSIIDWVMHEKNIGTKQAMEFLGDAESTALNTATAAVAPMGGVKADTAQNLGVGEAPRRAGSGVGDTTSGTHPKETDTYNYTDENGTLLYQVLRYEPKTFKQRRPVDDGWVWDLQGVTRVLYNLPQVLLSKTVCVTEGERDSNNLSILGYCATTNAGGSGAWLPAYADTLKGKDVIVFEDNDPAGKKRTPIILESLKDVAASVKVIKFSDCKDVTEWLEKTPETEKRKMWLEKLIDQTPHAVDPVPIYSISEMEDRYVEFIKELPKKSFGLGNFSKSLGQIVSQLYPGELIMVLGDTGQGKTSVMQAIAKSAAPLPLLFFELELPIEVMFARSVQQERGCFERDVIKGYTDVGSQRWASAFKGLQHIYICPEAGIGMERVESYITKSELKIGEHPSVVMLDYLGLVKGSREAYGRGKYETVANNAQQAKIVARRTNTIMFMGSQIGRQPGSREACKDVQLHMGKGAGEIEESANLVLGLTRPDDDTLKLKVLKFTRGKSGDEVLFDFDGAKLTLTERAA